MPPIHTHPVLLLALLTSAQPAAVPPVAELPGPVVLAGRGTPPDAARRELVALAGKDAAKVVVLTTDPKGGDGLLKPWRELKPQSVTLATTRDDPAKALADATAVWLDGDPAALARHPDTAAALRKLHARGGAVGMAGAADPLGLLPGFVIAADPKTPADRPGFVGLTISDGAAVVARGRTLAAAAGGVTVHVAAGGGREAVAQPADAGDAFDLFQLRRAAANRAAAEPFPPAKPADPVVPKGSLLVVGGGGAGADIWTKFIELAGGPDARIVVVPTAQEGPLAFNHPEVDALRRHGARKLFVLHTRNRAEADDPKFSDVLRTTGGVWFGGGRQWRFVDSYEGTLTLERFRGVLARGGVIGGSSAGASIQSEYMPRGHPLGNTVMAAEGYERGFGFLPGCAVDQHFFARQRTADMTGLMGLYPQYLGVGIDEGTAIVVKGSTAEVIGKSRVGFYDYRNGKPKGETDYTALKAGEKYDLKARTPLK